MKRQPPHECHWNRFLSQRQRGHAYLRREKITGFVEHHDFFASLHFLNKRRATRQILDRDVIDNRIQKSDASALTELLQRNAFRRTPLVVIVR